MSRDSDIELFALGLLGALDGAEAAAVAARLDARRPDDLEAIAAAEALVGAIGRTAPEVAPSVGARERLLERIAHDAPEVRSRAGSASALPPRPAAAPSPVVRRTRWLVPAVVGVAFLGLALLNALQGLRKPVATAESEISALLLDPSAERWVLADLKNPGGRPLAVVVGDVAQQRFFVASTRLAPPPKDTTYVLWTISKEPGAAPKNVGSIANSSDAKVIVEIATSLKDLAAVAVSVERDPKTTAPTADAIIALAKAAGG